MDFVCSVMVVMTIVNAEAAKIVRRQFEEAVLITNDKDMKSFFEKLGTLQKIQGEAFEYPEVYIAYDYPNVPQVGSETTKVSNLLDPNGSYFSNDYPNLPLTVGNDNFGQVISNQAQTSSFYIGNDYINLPETSQPGVTFSSSSLSLPSTPYQNSNAANSVASTNTFSVPSGGPTISFVGSTSSAPIKSYSGPDKNIGTILDHNPNQPSTSTNVKTNPPLNNQKPNRPKHKHRKRPQRHRQVHPVRIMSERLSQRLLKNLRIIRRFLQRMNPTNQRRKPNTYKNKHNQNMKRQINEIHDMMEKLVAKTYDSYGVPVTNHKRFFSKHHLEVTKEIEAILQDLHRAQNEAASTPSNQSKEISDKDIVDKIDEILAELEHLCV